MTIEAYPPIIDSAAVAYLRVWFSSRGRREWRTAGQQSGGAAKIGVITAITGNEGHQASHDFGGGKIAVRPGGQ